MNQENIGKFISELRKKNKMTQQELGEKLGVTDRTVSRWETGKYMPDLSLFPQLSTLLGVSCNDLMSGQIVDKKEYQEEFEKNIIESISKVDKSNKKVNIFSYIFIGVLSLLILWFLGYIFYCNYEFEQQYDSKNMSILKENDENLTFWSSSNGNVKILLMKYKDNDLEQGLIFLYYVKTLEQYHMDKRNLSQPGNSIDLIDKYTNGTGIIINDNMPNNYKVYYTNVSFNKISKADEEELQRIIKNSDLMFESK
jgi:Predicted transcriptional regulators